MIGATVVLVASLAQGTDPAPPRRVYEIRVPAPAATDETGESGDPLTGPFPSSEALLHFLSAYSFEALVLWLHPLNAGSDVAAEPRVQVGGTVVGRGAAPGLPLADRIQDLEARLGELDIRLARGRSQPTTSSGPVHRSLIWVEGDREHWIRRVTRPGVRDHLWWDPRFLGRQEVGLAQSLSADLVESCEPSLRAVQSVLDAVALEQASRTRDRDLLQALQRAFTDDPILSAWLEEGVDGQRLARSLLAQGRLASDLADYLGGQEPHRLLAFHNEWLGDRPSARRHTSQRRPPTPLDLAEWAFSETAFDDRPPVALDRPAPLAPPPWDTGSGEEDHDLGNLAGVLGDGDRLAFREFAHHRLQAAHEYAWLLASGQDSRRQAAFESLRQSREATRRLSAALTPAVDPGADHQAVLDAQQWRVEPTRWTLHELVGSRRRPLSEVTTWRLDEERFGDWPRALLDPAGGIDLRRLWSSTRGRQLVLTTELPQPETRTLRIEIGGPFRVTVTLNDVILAQRHSGTRHGPLLLALSLAPALNRLEVELVAEQEAATIPITMMPVPRQFEGVSLSPQRATRIREPLARLAHPLALDRDVLVVPDVHRVGSPLVGEAEFHFETNAPRRWDLWVHATAPAEATGQLEIEVDDRPHRLTVPPGDGWQWLRLPAPLHLEAGGHQVILRMQEPGVIVDALHLLITGTQFPRPPPGDGSLSRFAWRFDPLGRGHRFDLPTLTDQRVYQSAFTAEQSGHYEVYVWLRGTRALQPGETTQVELTTRSLSQRFFLPGGTPVEEWVRVGFLNLTEGDTIQMRAHGEGAPAFLCLIPG